MFTYSNRVNGMNLTPQKTMEIRKNQIYIRALRKSFFDGNKNLINSLQAFVPLSRKPKTRKRIFDIIYTT